MSMSPELVTGEAVPLELRLARLPSRMLSLSIDLTLQFAALFGLLAFFGATSGILDDAIAAAIALVLVVAVIVGYPTVMETFTRGRTVGKMALGLRVVRDDGGPVGFRQSLIRALAGFFIDIWVTSGVGALISSLMSSKGKRTGDMLAGTVVVRERVPNASAAPIWMPPPLIPWASTADLSRLPNDLALQARQFLGRAGQLAPDVRVALGARLATSVAQYVSPASPPGTPAEAYLAAVLAERRRRELDRYAAAPPYAPRPRMRPRPRMPPAVDMRPRRPHIHHRPFPPRPLPHAGVIRPRPRPRRPLRRLSKSPSPHPRDHAQKSALGLAEFLHDHRDETGRAGKVGTVNVADRLARADPKRLLVPVLVGAAVSVVLGVFAKAHDPAPVDWTLGFDSAPQMKSVLASVSLALALVQVFTALRMYRRIGTRPASIKEVLTHRISGALAVLVSLPVVYHCIWQFGYATYDTRVTVHSLAGCAFYGAFVAKMLSLKTKRLPGWAIPVLGGTVFTLIVVLWWTSALWWFQNSASY